MISLFVELCCILLLVVCFVILDTRFQLYGECGRKDILIVAFKIARMYNKVAVNLTHSCAIFFSREEVYERNIFVDRHTYFIYYILIVSH
jgi:hypothetical protein